MNVDYICLLATQIRFAKTDDEAQDVINQIRAYLEILPIFEGDPNTRLAFPTPKETL